jgi:hypothetical protein
MQFAVRSDVAARKNLRTCPLFVCVRGERPALASKTRETIDADFTGMFDPLTRGKIGELFGTGTNLTPDDILEGKVVVIDIPIAKYREVGQYAALIWAQLFQRAVDRRSYEAPSGRPVFLWEDEAHYFTIEQDALFQTTARSKGISVVRLTKLAKLSRRLRSRRQTQS